MPDDFDRQVSDSLSRLRSDVGHVSLADADSVRRRGIQRGRQRVAAGTLAVVVGAGFAGIGALGGFPGQDGRSPLVAAQSSPTAESEADTTDGGNPVEPDDTPTDDGHTADDDTTGTDQDGPTPDRRIPTGTPKDRPTMPDDDPTTPHDDPTTPDDEPSDTPTNTPTAPPEASDESLLAEDQMPDVDNTSSTWTETGTEDGEGTVQPVCSETTLSGLGATDSMRRDFTWGTDGTVYGFNTLGVFESTDDAVYAYESYSDWVEGCTWGEVNGPTEITVDNGQARWWWVSKDNGDGTGELEVIGLVQEGAAMSVVVWHEQTPEFEYSYDPMEPSLQDSAVLLRPYDVE